MHNLPLIAMLTGFIILLLLTLFHTPPSVGSFFKDIFTVGEDEWTWTTRDGEIFEEVHVEEIEGGEVMLRHRFGTNRVAIEALTQDSRRLLFRTPQWRRYLCIEPTAHKFSQFVPAKSDTAMAA